MSWDVYLNDNEGNPVEVKSHSEGGTYVVGGNPQAELNITYNYSPLYYKHLNKDGLSWLEGRVAKECITTLEKAVSSLGVEQDNDYWKATEGNAGYALSILLGWAKANPEATFSVS